MVVTKDTRVEVCINSNATTKMTTLINEGTITTILPKRMCKKEMIKAI
jgi:hypothetical protein